MQISFRLIFLILSFLIFSFQNTSVFSQTVRKMKGNWTADGKRIRFGQTLTAGARINNNNKSVPNNDLIVISDDACSDPLPVYCSKQDCNYTYYVPKSHRSYFFPCFLVRMFSSDARGGDVLGVNGIAEIKNGHIDLTEKVNLFEEEAGFIYFSPLRDSSDIIPRIRFESGKPLSVETNKPGLYKIIYKSDEYRILALESRHFSEEQKGFEEFAKSIERWKETVGKLDKEKVENTVIISMIWQRLDEIAGKYNLLHEKKKKK